MDKRAKQFTKVATINILSLKSMSDFQWRSQGGDGEGGLEPPHQLVKYAKSHVFDAFKADFWWKIENSPPKRNWVPKLWSRCRDKPFEFSVKTFFLETTCFWAEKTFEFPNFPRNSVSIFGQTVWNWFKNNENSGQGCLHFSHSFKKAPPFSKSWLRAWWFSNYCQDKVISDRTFKHCLSDQNSFYKAFNSWLLRLCLLVLTIMGWQ